MKMREENDIKVTGTPKTYGNGATRNTKEGKGRFDLIPQEVFEPLFTKAEYLSEEEIDCSPDKIITDIANDDMLMAIIKLTLHAYSDDEDLAEPYWFPALSFKFDCWKMLKDLAVHFQKGAEIYGERNCQKGIPLWSFKDSAMRHATQYFNEEEDEPHLISAIWNLWLYAWTEINNANYHASDAKLKKMIDLLNGDSSEANLAVKPDDFMKELIGEFDNVRDMCPYDRAKWLESYGNTLDTLYEHMDMLYDVIIDDAEDEDDDEEEDDKGKYDYLLQELFEISCAVVSAWINENLKDLIESGVSTQIGYDSSSNRYYWHIGFDEFPRARYMNLQFNKETNEILINVKTCCHAVVSMHFDETNHLIVTFLKNLVPVYDHFTNEEIRDIVTMIEDAFREAYDAKFKQS